MAIFELNKSKMNKLKITKFKNEKELQSVFENNLEEIFGIKFLATEYTTTHGGRIDTLGLDEDGSPVIIEYKENFISLSNKKKILGYQNLDDKKFMELCQIGATLHSKRITNKAIKDILYKLNYDVNSKNIKELKEFMLLKNPSVIFENSD